MTSPTAGAAQLAATLDRLRARDPDAYAAGRLSILAEYFGRHAQGSGPEFDQAMRAWLTANRAAALASPLRDVHAAVTDLADRCRTPATPATPPPPRGRVDPDATLRELTDQLGNTWDELQHIRDNPAGPDGTHTRDQEQAYEHAEAKHAHLRRLIADRASQEDR